MLRPTLIAIVFGVILTGGAAADDLEPNPDLAPERVVAIQLNALQKNDDPEPDAGIVRTWTFAHPDNKRFTGPIERFTAMLKGAGYGALINHRRHEIQAVVKQDDIAVFAVTIVAADGRTIAYQWQVSKVASGPLAGSWMTIGVSPPLAVDKAI